MRATTTTNTGRDYEEPLFGPKQLNYFIKSPHHYAEKAAWRLQGRTSTEGLCGSCLSQRKSSETWQQGPVLSSTYVDGRVTHMNASGNLKGNSEMCINKILKVKYHELKCSFVLYRYS